MIFQGIQKQRPHKSAAPTTITTIQDNQTLFFTTQKMNLKPNTNRKCIAAVRVSLIFDGIVSSKQYLIISFFNKTDV
jgi:uncharacterized protein (DUF927 family)